MSFEYNGNKDGTLFSTLQLLTYPESHVDEIYDESFLAA
jgi:hypothetical protein